jgi:hypothetical protein
VLVHCHGELTSPGSASVLKGCGGLAHSDIMKRPGSNAAKFDEISTIDINLDGRGIVFPKRVYARTSKIR